MTSPAEDAATLIVAANIGVLDVSTGWVIRIGTMTDAPDTQIGLFDTSGANPHPVLLLDYPHLQVQVRSSKGGYSDAYQKASDIRDLLLGMEPRDVGAGRWDGVTGLGGIMPLGRDDQNRMLLSANFRIILEPNSNGLTSRVPI